MIRYLVPIAMSLCASPALAESDELAPVPVNAVIGHPYPGDGAPSEIRFINVRSAPVTVVWVGGDGQQHIYGVIQPGEEWDQPTFVTHRWLLKDARNGAPVAAFISTRSGARDNGTAQIALIR
jgi:hypothetical protein